MNTINLREVNLDQTLDLIQATVAPNTLKAYQYALDKPEVCLRSVP